MNTWRYSYIEALGRPAVGCQTWKLNRSEDATAPCPQVQPLVRLNTCVHRHAHGHTYTTNAQIQTQLATLINTNRTYCLILFPSLNNQDEGLLVGNTHTHVYKVDQPVAGLVFAAVVPRNQSPQLLTTGHTRSAAHTPSHIVTCAAAPQ